MDGHSLISMRPLDAISLLYKIAETVPLKLTLGDRTPQFSLSFAKANHFPVPASWATVNSHFLPNLEGIGPEHYDLFSCHSFWSNLQAPKCFDSQLL